MPTTKNVTALFLVWFFESKILDLYLSVILLYSEWKLLVISFFLANALFSVRGYRTLIRKDSSTHMHALAVYFKEGLPLYGTYL